MAIMTRNFNEYDFGDPAEAAETVKRKALEFGADAVGIGSIDRWATAPLQMDPKPDHAGMQIDYRHGVPSRTRQSARH